MVFVSQPIVFGLIVVVKLKEGCGRGRKEPVKQFGPPIQVHTFNHKMLFGEKCPRGEGISEEDTDK